MFNMTKMIPPYISPEVRSGAERKTYEAIKAMNMGTFTCIHSLGLSKHLWKRQGEIDFVLITENSIYCLEVKGGRIERRDGVWYFTDRYGQENKKTEGPFGQASSAMHSLKKNLETKFGHTGFLFGYGVVMPDIEFKVDSPEWDQSIVFDLRDADKPFEKYFQRISAYWESKLQPPAPHVSRSEIINYMRGDFELATPLWKQIDDIEEQMTKFSEEQYSALDHMDSNPRIIFSGGAGTGKTLLAIEKARRSALNGKNVLLLCYNKLLGSRLHAEAEKIKTGGSLVHAESIHKYFFWSIVEAGLKGELDKKAHTGDSREVYDEVFADLFVQAENRLGHKKFDTLIIDEGQDLLSEGYLIALDSILEGGLKNGEWSIFLDPGAQARLFNKFSVETYRYLKGLGAPEYKLDINCRNTEQIATQATVVSGFPTGRARLSGPKVEYTYYKDDAEQAQMVIELVKKLVDDGLSPDQITILSTRARNAMSLLSSGAKLPRSYQELDEKNVNNPERGVIYYTSVQSYKGLENNVIVYMDVDKIDDEWIEGVNYVGMTRPREKLFVFFNKRVARKFEERLVAYAGGK